MKVVLCLVVGLALATITQPVHSTDSKERIQRLQIWLIESNLQSAEETTELMRLLRQVWEVDSKKGAYASNFASLAKTYLDGIQGNPYGSYQWSVTVDKKTTDVYQRGTYYAIFKVRRYLHTYIVRLFSTS